MGENPCALVYNFLMGTLISLTTFFPTIVTYIAHPSIILFVTCPSCGATELISGSVRIGNAFIVGKIANIIQIIEFDPINPHFSFGIVPLVPRIWSIQKVATNGNIQN